MLASFFFKVNEKNYLNMTFLFKTSERLLSCCALTFKFKKQSFQNFYNLLFLKI